jgi:hypothetical protein
VTDEVVTELARASERVVTEPLVELRAAREGGQALGDVRNTGIAVRMGRAGFDAGLDGGLDHVGTIRVRAAASMRAGSIARRRLSFCGGCGRPRHEITREAAMYRHSTFGQVQTGEWKKFYELYEKLDERLAAKNLPRRQLWAPTVGTNNAFILTSDHETLAAWERDNTAFFQDGDVMDLWRDIARLLEEPSIDELWQTAGQIA